MNQESVLIKDGFKLFRNKGKLFYKYNITQEISHPSKQIFLVTIISLDSIKILSHKDIFTVMNIILDDIKANNPKISKETAMTLTILDLRKGVRFVPDIQIIRKAALQKESASFITSGGMVIILPENSRRLKRVINEIVRFLAKDRHLLAISTYEEAMQKLQEFALEN